MPAGGKRAGAGRKPGSSKSGREKALRSAARVAVAEIVTTSRDPLKILVEIAANPAIETTLRIQAAGAAVPFCHPRLSASVIATASTNNARDAKALQDDIMLRLDRMAGPPIIDGIVDEAA